MWSFVSDRFGKLSRRHARCSANYANWCGRHDCPIWIPTDGQIGNRTVATNDDAVRWCWLTNHAFQPECASVQIEGKPVAFWPRGVFSHAAVWDLSVLEPSKCDPLGQIRRGGNYTDDDDDGQQPAWKPISRGRQLPTERRLWNCLICCSGS